MSSLSLVNVQMMTNSEHVQELQNGFGMDWVKIKIDLAFCQHNNAHIHAYHPHSLYLWS